MGNLITNVKFGEPYCRSITQHKPKRKGEKLTLLGTLAIALALAVGIIIGTILSQGMAGL